MEPKRRKSMNRKMTAAALMTAFALAPVLPARAEDAPASAQSADPQQRQREAQMAMQQMMGPMMAQMMSAMVEAMSQTFAKKEIADNFATFTRNYYLALVKNGFTEEEALKIVVSSGLPSMGGKQ
jgi:hypothetical protein